MRQNSQNSNPLTSDEFDGEEDDYGEPVEHVVDGGAGKSPPEIFAIPDLAQRHDRVRDGRPNVGSHDHRD